MKRGQFWQVALAVVLIAATAGGNGMATRAQMPRNYWSWQMPDGTMLNLTSASGVHVEYVGGVGMPPVRNVIQNHAIMDGGMYQRTKALPRIVTFVFTAIGCGLDGLAAIRAKLIQAISFHEVGRPPIRAFYYGLSRVMYIDLIYDGGLEGGNLAGIGSEKLAVRFIAADPYWMDAVTRSETDLDGMTVLSDVSRVLERGVDGQWSNLGGGVNNTVYDVLYDDDGNLYVTGTFTAMSSLWEPFDGAALRAPFASSVAGGGTVTVGGGACILNSTGAVADAAMLIYNAALNVGSPGYIHCRYIAATILDSRCEVFVISQNAVAPAVGAVGTYNIYVWQMIATGDFRIIYVDNALATWYWNGAAWQAGVFDLPGNLSTIYQVDFENDGTSWYLVLRDANGAALYTTTAVTWALTRNTGAPRWFWCGDASAGAMRSGHYIFDIKIVDAAVPANRIAMWNKAEQMWQTLDSGLNGDGYCLAWAVDGTLYVGGNFTTAGGGAAVRVARWNPVLMTWVAVGAGLDNIVWDIAFGNTGILYATGQFVNIAGGGAAVNYVAQWDGAAWAAMGAGFDAVGYAVGRATDGRIYFGGWFTTAGGGGAAGIAVWDPVASAWAALGAGVGGASPIVTQILIAPNGLLYAFGPFTTAGGLAAAGAATWNGAGWRAMGNGFTTGYVIASAGAFAPDGTIFVGGTLSASGTYPISPRYAFWRDPVWIAGDGDTNALTIDALVFADDGTMAIGGYFVGVLKYPYWFTLTNIGGARALPSFTVNGPGRLYHIVNHTTGARLDFNIALLAGEILTVDVQAKTVTSNFRGNMISAEIGHALGQFYLAPGTNYLSLFVDENIMLNPGFETAGGGGADVFGSWSETAGPGAIARVATPHSGSWAAQLTGVDTTYIDQTFNCLPGEQYHLEFWTRGDGTWWGQYSIWDVTNGVWIVDITDTLIANAIYTSVDRDFTIPAGCFQFRVRLYPTGGGSAYFDDVAIFRTDHKIEYVPRYLSIDKAHD